MSWRIDMGAILPNERILRGARAVALDRIRKARGWIRRRNEGRWRKAWPNRGGRAERVCQIYEPFAGEVKVSVSLRSRHP